MIIASDGDAIGPEQIPEEVAGARRPTTLGSSPRTFVELKAEAERQVVVGALERNGWHVTRTAQALGLADTPVCSRSCAVTGSAVADTGWEGSWVGVPGT